MAAKKFLGWLNLDNVPNLASERDREMVAIDDALKLPAEMDPAAGRLSALCLTAPFLCYTGVDGRT